MWRAKLSQLSWSGKGLAWLLGLRCPHLIAQLARESASAHPQNESQQSQRACRAMQLGTCPAREAGPNALAAAIPKGGKSKCTVIMKHVPHTGRRCCCCSARPGVTNARLAPSSDILTRCPHQGIQQDFDNDACTASSHWCQLSSSLHTCCSVDRAKGYAADHTAQFCWSCKSGRVAGPAEVPRQVPVYRSRHS